MNKRYTKMAAAFASVAILTAALLPVVAPEAVTAAKWYVSRESNSEQTQIKDNSKAAKEEILETPEAVEAYKTVAVQAIEEAVITKHDGQTERVAIVAPAAEAIAVAVLGAEELKQLQYQAESEQKPWLFDPVLVLRTTAAQYGFDDKEDTFTLLSIDKTAGKAKVLVEHDGRYYLVQLSQPVGEGTKKIWQVRSIQQVKITNQSNTGRDKVDVGPGVEGLDYDKVIKWQQDVDAGRDRWRLNPLEVARQEGKAYGFDADDTITILRQFSSTTLARHGQIDLEIKHQGKVYTMIVVKPFGGGDAIWTIYKVTGPAKPERPIPAPGEKVLYTNNSYRTWQWYDDQYPRGMNFAIVTSLQEAKAQERLADKLTGVDFSRNIAITAYLGQASGGYNIGIEKVVQKGNQITVSIRTKSPRWDEMTTKNITYPADYIVLDKQVIDIWGGVTIAFVDQAGTMLEKIKVSVKH